MSNRLEPISGPSIEPITVADARDFLRLTTTTDDTLLASLIVAARSYCETVARRAFVSQGWTWYLDCFPAGGGYYNRNIRAMGQYGLPVDWLPTTTAPIELPKPSVLSVDSVKYYDVAGTLQTIDPSLYVVSLGLQGRIQPTYGKVWPIPQPRIDAVQIAFTAGFGGDAAAVPEVAKVAIRLCVTHLYENRGEANVPMPDAIAAVLSPITSGLYL